MNIVEGTTEKKPAARKAKKAPPAAAANGGKKKEVAAGEFGERPDTLKGRLIALLVKGKPVKVADACQALYGVGNPAPIGGVIKGATIAFEKAGARLVKEGTGPEATLTFSRKK